MSQPRGHQHRPPTHGSHDAGRRDRAPRRRHRAARWPGLLAVLVAVLLPAALAGSGASAQGDQAQPDRTTPRETTTTVDRNTGDRPTTTERDDPDDEPDDETTTTREPTTTTEAETTTTEPATTTTVATEPDEDGDEDADDGGSGGALMLVLGILLGASAGAAIGWFAGRGAPGARSAAPAAPAPVAAGPVADQRATLVAACIAAVDLTQNEGVREQLSRALESAGVRRLEVDGETFDASRHHAVDRLHTDDPAKHNTVITDRAGWVDGTQVIRLPEVIVYRTD